VQVLEELARKVEEDESEDDTALIVDIDAEEVNGELIYFDISRKVEVRLSCLAFFKCVLSNFISFNRTGPSSPPSLSTFKDWESGTWIIH
jgi:hypothetical protein